MASKNDYGNFRRSRVMQRDGCGLGAAARRPCVIHQQDGRMVRHRLRGAVSVGQYGAALDRGVGTERQHRLITVSRLPHKCPDDTHERMVFVALTGPGNSGHDVNIQALGLGAAASNRKLRSSVGLGVAVVGERGFRDDCGL